MRHFLHWPCLADPDLQPAVVEIGQGKGSGEAASQCAQAALLAWP